MSPISRKELQACMFCYISVLWILLVRAVRLVCHNDMKDVCPTQESWRGWEWPESSIVWSWIMRSLQGRPLWHIVEEGRHGARSYRKNSALVGRVQPISWGFIMGGNPLKSKNLIASLYDLLVVLWIPLSLEVGIVCQNDMKDVCPTQETWIGWEWPNSSMERSWIIWSL